MTEQTESKFIYYLGDICGIPINSPVVFGYDEASGRFGYRLINLTSALSNQRAEMRSKVEKMILPELYSERNKVGDWEKTSIRRKANNRVVNDVLALLKPEGNE